MSAKKMVKVLSDINEMQKTSERQKLKVYSKHFWESLEYKRERGRLTVTNTHA